MPIHEDTQALEHSDGNAGTHIRTTFVLPAELHQRLRVSLAKDGRTMQEVLVGMVEAWVRKREES